MGAVVAVLLGVWGIVARYDSRLRDKVDAQGKETSQEIGQLLERRAKLEGHREAVTGNRAA